MSRRIGWAILLALMITPSFAQDSATDREHTQWIGSVLRSIQTIKPGMTREQLLKVFTVEGGLSTRLHRTYVYKQCPYIKVSVEFTPVGNLDDRLAEMPGDKIRTISPPFLQYAIVD
jgi:hypothetical protein